MIIMICFWIAQHLHISEEKKNNICNSVREWINCGNHGTIDEKSEEWKCVTIDANWKARRKQQICCAMFVKSANKSGHRPTNRNLHIFRTEYIKQIAIGENRFMQLQICYTQLTASCVNYSLSECIWKTPLTTHNNSARNNHRFKLNKYCADFSDFLIMHMCATIINWFVLQFFAPK